MFPAGTGPAEGAAGAAPESSGGSAHACFCQWLLFTQAWARGQVCAKPQVGHNGGQSIEGTKHRSAAFLAGRKGWNFICLKWDFRCPGLQDKRTALPLTAGMDGLWNVFLEGRFAYMYACIVKHPGSRRGSGCGTLYSTAPARAVCSVLLSSTCTHSPDTRTLPCSSCPPTCSHCSIHRNYQPQRENHCSYNRTLVVKSVFQNHPGFPHISFS